MDINIETRKFKDVDLSGGIILDCIPTVSIVSGIVGTHIVSQLDLDQAFALESDKFPPVSMVFSKKPKFPARGYVSEKLKLAVVLTEFQPTPALSRPLAYKLLACHDEYKCSKIVSFEGLPVQNKGTTTIANGSDIQQPEPSDDEPKVFGLGSNDHARDLIDAAGINQMETGMIVGVTAVLMNEGRWRNRDVISLIGEVKDNISNIRVAARLVEAFNKIFPKFDIDVKPLLKEAQKMEKHFETIQTQARPVLDDASINIYR